MNRTQAMQILMLNSDASFDDVKYAFPLSRGHTLVIPKYHYEKVQDMTDIDSNDLFDVVHKVISKVDKLTGSTLLAIHNGKDSGQEIPHVHVHLIPRKSDDQAGPVHSMFKDRPKLYW